MSIEATLTRELNIRFIDARNIASKAKLELGIIGYPSPEQVQDVICRSISIFQNKPESIQETMQCLKNEFDTMKDASIGSSNHSHGSTSDNESLEETPSSTKSSPKKWIKKSLTSFTRGSV